MFKEFINEIRKKIAISFSNGRLKYYGPKQYIDEEFISFVLNDVSVYADLDI